MLYKRFSIHSLNSKNEVFIGNPLVHVDLIVVGHTIVAGQKVVGTDTKCQ